MYNDDEFKKLIEETGISPEVATIQQLKLFFDLLVEKNKVMNLTAITEYDDVVIKHFIDSLLIKRVLPLVNATKADGIKDFEKANIVDIGTGAGFPGIPLKIAMPDISMTLIDSLNKRIRFIEETTEELGLSGISAMHGRSEELGQGPEYREIFEYAVSRAVADLSVLSEYCLPFVKPGGIFIAYKAADIDKEVESASNAIRTLGGKLIVTERKTVPGSDIVRSFVIIKKESSTPSKYPRKPGTPAKQPL